MTLRVVHVISSGAFAGVERYVAVLAASQDALGNDVSIIGGDQEAMRGAVGRARIRIRPARSMIQAARAIDAWRDCDVLHVHMTAAESAAVVAVRARRSPVVSTRHFAQHRGASVAGHLARRIVAKRIAHQIAVSDYVARRIEGESTVVHPGVPDRPGLSRANDRTRTVLVAQRLQREKDTQVAVRAFHLSGLADRGWSLQIAGTGADLTHLTRLAKSLGLANSVHFLGFRSDVAELMQESGIFFASSPGEHFGLSVLEAMAAALPVVAVGAAGHLETVGMARQPALFAPHDAAAAARLLSGLAANPSRRDEYGAELQALQRDKFTVEAQALAIDVVYRSVL